MIAAETDTIAHGDPFALFDQWFAAAVTSEPHDPNAMALATATRGGAPSVRMVLLKRHGPDGFVFYTNLHSRKGDELRANPQAGILFHWKSLRRQVRAEGVVHELTAAEADAYFASRSYDSQLGSAASDQSRALDSRATYLARVEALRAQYPDGDVPRPPQWSGYRLVPHAIEFWCDGEHRLHERRRFLRADPAAPWTSTLLYP